MNNPKSRQSWIIDELSKRPHLTFKECFSVYSAKFSKSEQTFAKDWNKARDRHEAIQEKVQAAKEEAIIKAGVSEIERGIETKSQRVLSLQRQKEATERELELGTTEDTKFVGNKAQKVVRAMTVHEKAALRRVIRDLSSEISKLQGDYKNEDGSDTLVRLVSNLAIDDSVTGDPIPLLDSEESAREYGKRLQRPKK